MDPQFPDAPKRRGQRLLRALFRRKECWRSVGGERLARHTIEALRTRNDLTILDLTLTQALERRRCVEQLLSSAQFDDRSDAVAGIGETHAFGTEEARRRHIFRGCSLC
jgi:hypothetical protein